MVSDYISAGISIIPVKPDKRPLVDWKPYQARIATKAEAGKWKAPIAAVCGKVSGGLMCIDFDDGGSAFKPWGELVAKHFPNVPKRVCVQKTPSGGYHVFFRTAKEYGNLKLAQAGEPPKLKVLIETRGEGGYFLIDPSDGYKLKRGSPANVQTLTDDETDGILDIARSFNEYRVEHRTPSEVSKPIERSGKSPFDDYDERETPISVLEGHGWKVISERGGKVVLCRPDKQRGISATWNHVPNRFYVFTSSTQFNPQEIYKASAVFAILEHNSDYVAAAKDLAARGYGDRLEMHKVDVDQVPALSVLKVSDFRERIYDFYTKPREAGFFTGMPTIDGLLRLDRGFLNVVTGIPSHGKSSFVDFWTILISKKYGWKWVMFSPENYPLEIHYNKLAELYHGKSMYGAERYELDEAIDFIDEHYSFIDCTDDETTLDGLLECVPHTVDGFVLDPWNELENTRPRDMNDSEYTGVCLRRLRKFGRKHNVCMVIVAHPAKMYRNKEEKKYPMPTLYDIAGSANWYNKADNGVVVYRDFDSGITTVSVKKVKYKNYGKVGDVSFRYVYDSGEYQEIETQKDW